MKIEDDDRNLIKLQLEDEDLAQVRTWAKTRRDHVPKILQSTVL